MTNIKNAQMPDLTQYSITGVPDLTQYTTKPEEGTRYYELDQPEGEYVGEVDVPKATTRAISSDAVKEMQQAILNFGSVLSAHPIMSMQPSGTQERGRVSGAQEYLGGTDPFGNFLVSQYVNNAKVVGNQFVNIDMPEPLRTSTATPNVNLKSIIGTLSRIGSPGAERKVDGVWQTRTNNALKQIYSIGSALLHFAKDTGVDIAGFTMDNLEAFKNLIPESYTDLGADISRRAMQLTKFINALTVLYKKFEAAILERPEFKAIISQDKPLADHSGRKVEELNKDEQTLYNQNKDAVIPGANINGKPVRLMDVANIEAFKKFLQSANVDISHPDAVLKNISLVKNLLQTSGAGF